MTRYEFPLTVSWHVRVYLVMKPCLCFRGGGYHASERAVELTAEMTKFTGAVGTK